jgi:hypothetical protein
MNDPDSMEANLPAGKIGFLWSLADPPPVILQDESGFQHAFHLHASSFRLYIRFPSPSVFHNSSNNNVRVPIRAYPTNSMAAKAPIAAKKA